MLILTRHPGEKIRIGKDIEVIVIGHRFEQVSIGINAPQNVRILRDDVISKARKAQKKLFNKKEIEANEKNTI
jgi:carbon storage regulator